MTKPINRSWNKKIQQMYWDSIFDAIVARLEMAEVEEYVANHNAIREMREILN